jgi:hypothetical protein
MSASVDLQELWAACISSWNVGHGKSLWALPYTAGKGLPCPPFLDGKVMYSLGGWNPHGEVIATPPNEEANVRLRQAVAKLAPTVIMNSMSFGGDGSWLERGFSITFDDVGVDSPAGLALEASVLALALEFRQSGVCRYTPCPLAVSADPTCILQTMLPTSSEFGDLRSETLMMFAEPSFDHPSLSKAEWSNVYPSFALAAHVLENVRCCVLYTGRFLAPVDVAAKL